MELTFHMQPPSGLGWVRLLSEVQRSTEAIADPGKSPTAWAGLWERKAGMPKRELKKWNE